mgnify:CR=1 FL=1
MVDQRDVQRLGGKAAKFPSSFVVADILVRHGIERVLDVTYGRGRFYYIYKPPLLFGADPKKWEWVTEPDVFIQAPVWALRRRLDRQQQFDAVVCDPPVWRKGVRYNGRPEYNYVLGSARLIIDEAVRLARMLGVKFFLLHIDRLMEFPVVEDIQFRYVARYLNLPELRTTHFTLYRVV